MKPRIKGGLLFIRESFSVNNTSKREESELYRELWKTSGYKT